MKLSSKLPMLALTLTLASCGMDQSHPQASPLILTPPSTKIGTGTTGIDPLCHSVKIVDLSRFDTDLTKQQVIANNAVLHNVCGDD